MLNWKAYLELLRLPAVFTAVADVMMGYLVRQGDLRPPAVFLSLVAASSCLYLAGMVFNDAFDAEVDARERPERPIPSGRISQSTACRLGWGMLVGGFAFSVLATWLAQDRGPVAIAGLLALFVYMYDVSAKRRSIGPLVMGFCRFLNVLLGMSLVGGLDGMMTRPWSAAEMAIATGVGVYIIGVTIFARTEAQPSSRRVLVAGFLVQLAGLAMLCFAPVWSAVLIVKPTGWYLLWAAITLILARRCLVAIAAPSPPSVQAAVRHSLQSIIVIDAAIVCGLSSIFWGCMILLLLLPMLLLERWFNTT